MSGDSSGRRPEGRGRGRDPHRDRTRSRSRSRSPLARRGAAPERREAAERPSLEDTEPSDSGDELLDPACLEAEYDQGLCRQIRHQYRALINSVQRKVALWGCAGRRRSVTGQGGWRRGRRPVGAGWRQRASVCLLSAPLATLAAGAQVPCCQLERREARPGGDSLELKPASGEDKRITSDAFCSIQRADQRGPLGLLKCTIPSPATIHWIRNAG